MPIDDLNAYYKLFSGDKFSEPFLNIMQSYYFGVNHAIPGDIKPGHRDAAKAMSEWLDKKFVLADFQPLSKDSITRQRLRISINPKLIGILSNQTQQVAWTIALRLLPKHIGEVWLNYLDHTKGDFEGLKEIGGIYKKYNTLISPDWFYYVDGQLVGDYFTAPTPEEIEKLVSEWVRGNVTHEFSDGISFNTLFQATSNAFIDQDIAQPSKQPLRIEQFLSDPLLWATSGSSDAKRLFVDVKGQNIKARKSKWATALSITLPELMVLFFDDSPQVNRSATKRELGKARMIIAGDMRNYLRMSYVSYWLEDVLRDHPNMTIFFNRDKMLQLWLKMIDDTNGSGVNMPSDESKWDHNISNEMVLASLNSIKNLINKYVDNQWYKNTLLNTMDMIIKSIVGTGVVTIRMNKGIKRINIQKGLLSGWRWTALLNSLVNGSKNLMFQKVIQWRSGVDLPVTDSYCVLGDDVRTHLKSYEYANAFVELYQETGFDLNPNKFFISERLDEYLRKVAMDAKIIQGYPLRGVSSLVFANPASNLPKPGESRMRELFSNWILSIKRMRRSIHEFEPLIARDIANANGLNSEDVIKWMHAMSSLGGGGVMPYNNLEVVYTPSVANYDMKVRTAPLFARFTDESNTLTKRYLSAVQFTKKVPVTYTQFTIRFNESVTPSAVSYMPSPSNIRFPICEFKPNMTPIEVEVAKIRLTRMKRSELRNNTYMTEYSKSVLYNIMNRSSLFMIREWINGFITGNTPITTQGPLRSSIIYDSYFYSDMTSMFFNGPINTQRYKKIKIKSELLTQEYCARLTTQVLD